MTYNKIASSLIPPDNVNDLLLLLNNHDWVFSLNEEEKQYLWEVFSFSLDAIKTNNCETEKSTQIRMLNSAKALMAFNLDIDSICASFLYSAIEIGCQSIETVCAKFKTKPDLLKIVNELKNLEDYSKKLNNLSILQKILNTVILDVRIIVIRLIQRLHLLKKLHLLPENQKKVVATEALEVLAPIAERLGMWETKSQLEDLSFRYLFPNDYSSIANEIKRIRSEQQTIIDEAIHKIKDLLPSFGIPPDQFSIAGRPKHIYSIYKKMHTPKYLGKGVERIYDKLGIRVIVQTIPQCYAVLGAIHSEWQPITGEFDDFIGTKLPSGYQSLHTAIRYSSEKHDVIEFQIRTQEMHHEAEFGIAAHWKYKEKAKLNNNIIERISSLRQMIETLQQGEDVDSLKSELLQRSIYVFTPKGDVIDLPAGSTPIDFAYAIHTEVGHRCRGARVNGKMVSLDYVLKSGERVSILTTNRGGPSRDWMNGSLGYTGSARTRSKIRQWFRNQEREQNILQGREVVERELRRLGLADVHTVSDIAKALKFDDEEQFLAKVGFGDIQSRQISGAIALMEKNLHPDDELRPLLLQAPPKKQGLTINGVSGLHTRMAKCCQPIPPEPITGFITRGQGVTIHRADCAEVQNTTEPERLITVEWGDDSAVYPIPIVLKAYRRPNIIEEIVSILRGQKINTPKTKTTSIGSIMTISLVVEVTSLEQLNWLLQKLESLPNVMEAHRQRW
jgi:guanosine-3',5'-bis(diphosphate) 3'-pyrophosphohydrolase